MDKKYIFLLSFILLALIFTSFFLLTENDFTYTPDTLLHQTQPTQLVFSSSWGGYDTKAEEISHLLTTFQEDQEDFEIINNSIGGEDFLLSLKTDFISGKAPDVFGLWPGSDIEQLVEQGRVADLTDILDSNPEWYDLFGKDAWNYVTYNERIYGLPYELIYEGLFINNDILEKHGLSIPKTYEELLALCITLRELNYIPIAYNGTPEGSFLYQNIVMSLGGKEDVEIPFDTNGNLKSCFVNGMYYLKELHDNGAFPEDYYVLSDQDRNALFLNKQAVMIVQGSWFIGDNSVPANSKDVEIVPFPTFPESKADPTAIIYGCGNGVYHMSSIAYADDTKRDIAINLLKHLTNETTALRSINTFGGIVNIQVSEDKINAPLMYYMGNFHIKNAAELIGPVDSFIDRNIWENIIVTLTPNVLDGAMTPESVIRKVESAYSEQQH